MAMLTDGDGRRQRARSEIVDVAARLLQEGGPGAVTTRGVAEAAGVQAPAIYRLFGDKDGLIEAVAEHVMATYVAAKAGVVQTAAAELADPVADLRRGWDTHIGFGLANPALFTLLSDPARRSPAGRAGLEVLRSRVHRVALAGRLRVTESRAVDLVHAAGTGAVLTLLALPPAERDLALSDAMYEAVAAAVLHAPAGPGRHGDPSSAGAVRSAAVTLRAAVPDEPALSAGERALLVEWLDRIADARTVIAQRG